MPRHLELSTSLGRSLALVLLGDAGRAGCRSAAPTDAGRADLIVRGPSGSIHETCVRLAGEKATGEQLLLDFGWEVSLDASNPMGSIVCAIDGEGFRFPSEDCLCQCSALGSCSCWAYFIQAADGSWVYSPLGARANPAKEGGVNAWAWVSGTRTEPGDQQALLPEAAFSGVCPPP